MLRARFLNVYGCVTFFFVLLCTQIRGTVVLGTVWNAETAVISWFTFVSSVRVKIQSGHATACIPRTDVSRDARAVS